MTSFGERLRLLRREKDLGQKEVAAWLGMSQSTIGKYEHDERTPSPDVVKKLAEKFDVSTDYLLGNSEIRKPLLDSSGNSEFARMVKQEMAEMARTIFQKSQPKPDLSPEQTWLLDAYGQAPEAIKQAVRSILKPYELNEKEKAV